MHGSALLKAERVLCNELPPTTNRLPAVSRCLVSRPSPIVPQPPIVAATNASRNRDAKSSESENFSFEQRSGVLVSRSSSTTIEFDGRPIETLSTDYEERDFESINDLHAQFTRFTHLHIFNISNIDLFED